MNISKNKIIGLGIIGVLVLVGVFFLGASFGVKQLRALQGSQNVNGGMVRGTRNVGGFGGFVNGKIIAKDSNSITVQTVSPVGGSKIIFLDSNTKVAKTVDGKITDLTIGEQVSVTGAANPDGSVNAQSVQIRASAPATK